MTGIFPLLLMITGMIPREGFLDICLATPEIWHSQLL